MTAVGAKRKTAVGPMRTPQDKALSAALKRRYRAKVILKDSSDDPDRTTIMGELLDFLGYVISGFFDGAPAKSRWRRWVERVLAGLTMALAALVIYCLCK